MRNRLLDRLPVSELDLIRPHLEHVELPAQAIIQPAGEPAVFVHFVEEGLASVLIRVGTECVEVAIVGPEGLAGVSALLDADVCFQEEVMQVAGTVGRIRADALRELRPKCPALSRILLRYVQFHLVQVAHTALANGRNTVEQRLARWLLMAGDRLEGPDLPLTHQMLSLMLGVRRPGVTVALHVLEGAHAIRSRRAKITILDRNVLRGIAGAAYGPTEAAYASLFGSEGSR
jgi:CRP-like cAMP-binding protein